LPTLKKTK